MKISIGADHKGFELKQHIINSIREIEWIDVGTNSQERTDYPIFAKKVVYSILEKKSDLGILLCNSGIGMSIAANRFKGIYAALCWNKQIAISSKEDDNSNIIVIPAGFIDNENIENIIFSWVNSTFKGGIYNERLKLLDQ